MDMSDALPTFIAESRELLGDMETALLSLEDEPRNVDGINAIFRTAHTIKGSAGLFGLDNIVRFTHVVESVLDKVRGGEIEITPSLISLLLGCCDHMGELISMVEESSSVLDADGQATQQGLLEQLNAVLKDLASGVSDSRVVIPVAPSQESPVEKDESVPVVADSWHISLRFGRDVLRNGMDPLSFLRYLKTLGQIVALNTLVEQMPAVEEMDPESCYLGFEIDFMSNMDKQTVADVFEFVREDCIVHILPPHSRVADYGAMIRSLPDEPMQLGEMLVASGALTRQELEDALNIQRCPFHVMPQCCNYKAKCNDPSECACQAYPDQACLAPSEPKPHVKLGDVLLEQNLVQKELIDEALKKQTAVKESKVRESKYIRVQADKLDQLINLVGELVIAGASASLIAHREGGRQMQEATSNVSRLVEEIRDGALQLRMVPIGETFNKFQRVVRDVSKEIGKEIDLVISGAEAELDKTVVEKIGDPLTHLIRNAMDHGIEDVGMRRARGKPDKGTVQLNAYHDSGNIVIEISDDGGGLKRDKIIKKAIENELIGPNQTLTDQEVYSLIFEPGFSTADQVTNLSGRGVGMDVVKRNITALRGAVEIDSKEGIGTTVRIRLPLTLAIIDGFAVAVGGSTYVIPLDTVVECVELSRAGGGETMQGSYINLRGEVLPLVHLREQFDVDGAKIRRESVVVVQYAGRKAGFVVDTLVGEFQTVIKPLGKLFTCLRGISGSTILGGGEVALIIDVPALVQEAATQESSMYVKSGQNRPDAISLN